MSFKKSLGKSIVLLLIILILIIGGLLWFDYLGVVQVKSMFAPVYKMLGKEPQSSVTATQTAPLSANLDEDRLRKQKEANDDAKLVIILHIRKSTRDFFFYNHPAKGRLGDDVYIDKRVYAFSITQFTL